MVKINIKHLNRSWATKCESLNYETCVTRPFLMDWNPTELKLYPVMLSLNGCNGRCNIDNNLFAKNMCFKQNKRHKCYLKWSQE